MANIKEVRAKVIEFSRETFGVKDVKVISAGKVKKGWDAEVEVLEDNAVVKAAGIPAQVKDQNIYSIKMDEDLNIFTYKLEEKRAQEKVDKE